MSAFVDHYATLGIAPTSDDVVVRAAFKALMLKYHPDTNTSADAHARAAKINAAYEVLRDPKSRADYDAKRNAQRGNKPKADAPKPPPSPPPKAAQQPSASRPDSNQDDHGLWAAMKDMGVFRFAPLLVLVVVVAGIDLATRDTPSYGESNLAIADQDIAFMTDNMMIAAPTPVAEIAPAIVEPALVRLTGTPDPIDFNDIERAAADFERTLQRGGITGAREWSERCHAAVLQKPSWSGADQCAAFDFAAAYIDDGMVRVAGVTRNGYFQFAADNQADRYVALGAPAYLLSERLRQVRNAAQPAVAEAVTSAIYRREQEAQRAASEEGESSGQNRLDAIMGRVTAESDNAF